MDTSRLKTFAQSARTKLIEQVGNKLKLVLNENSAARRESPEAIKELEKAIKGSSEGQVTEQVAYTWFNRFCALRYLDVKRYSKVLVVSPAEGQFQPEILAEAKAGIFDDSLVKEESQRLKIQGLLRGSVPSLDPQGEAYRLLVVAVCNSWHETMPFLFEKIADYTELLMPDDLLAGNSILASTREAMTPESCESVEVIGWLYQFYISEKKDTVMARKSAVPTEDIPAVTQLFTPHWIVRYLVENSLGRLWLMNNPSSKLREKMPYYIEEVESVKCEVGSSSPASHSPLPTSHLIISSPEEIRILDPACGSGHMLTYAFDLLYAIYEEQGYEAPSIPGLILKHNLYGVDICPRAAALAAFALVMKAREKSRRFFSGDKLVLPNITELVDVNFAEGELHAYFKAIAPDRELTQMWPGLSQLCQQFEEAKNFGSLIQPCLTEAEVQSVLSSLHNSSFILHNSEGQLFLRETHLKVLRVLEQAEALTQRYHVIVANPPYMGGKGMNVSVKRYLQEYFTDYGSDLFSGFIVRSLSLSLPNGYLGFMSPFVWMFISSYEKLRERLVVDATITTLVQLEYSGFDGATVPICTFTLQNKYIKAYRGGYVRLSAFRGSENQSPKTLEAIANRDCGWFFRASADDFKKIPGSPIVYWLSNQTLASFSVGVPVGNVISLRAGMSTGDNTIFQRQWHEVSAGNFCRDALNSIEAHSSAARWFPCHSGGEYRKWYGNHGIIVDWENDGLRIKGFGADSGRIRSAVRNEDYYYLEGVTWSKISSGMFAARYRPTGFLFDDTGRCGFTKEPAETYKVLALFCSKLSDVFLKALCPTLSFTSGEIAKIPFIEPDCGEIITRTKQCIYIARADWDNFETSWDFRDQPLLRPGLKGATLEASWRNWEAQSSAAIRRMQELETENNRLFIAAYGLDGELQPEVPEAQITLARAEARRDMAAFLSYAVGCMMGRYCPDHPGLILANAGDTIADYIRIVGSGKWEVGSSTDAAGNNKEEVHECEELSGTHSLAESDGFSGNGLPGHSELPQGGSLRSHQSNSACSSIHSLQHSGWTSSQVDSGISQFLVNCERFKSRSGNPNPSCPALKICNQRHCSAHPATIGGDRAADLRTAQQPSLDGESSDSTHCPLSTIHFLPDEDGIIPVLDGEWFEDDIVARFRVFLRTTFGDLHFEQNLAFIESALGNDLRSYFVKDFYKFHVQTYKKRPIYWMFSSAKGGFQALVYLHRYRPDTVSQLLNGYLRQFRTKLSLQQERLQAQSINPNLSAREKTAALKELEKLKKLIAEVEAYERDIIFPLATQNLDIDLDEGVKVNYLRFGEALKTITGLAAKEDE